MHGPIWDRPGLGVTGDPAWNTTTDEDGVTRTTKVEEEDVD